MWLAGMYIQWNLSNPGHHWGRSFSEMSEGEMHARVVIWGWKRCPIFRDVSSIQIVGSYSCMYVLSPLPVANHPWPLRSHGSTPRPRRVCLTTPTLQVAPPTAMEPGRHGRSRLELSVRESYPMDFTPSDLATSHVCTL